MNRKKEKLVFVSYSYTTENGIGFGNTTQFYTHSNIITTDDIRDMEKSLKEQCKFKTVVILNYQFM